MNSTKAGQNEGYRVTEANAASCFLLPLEVESGRIKAWLGEKQLVDFTGVTANPENATTSYPSPSRFYFKMGLYRNVMPQPMTIYIDEYRKEQLPQNGL